MSKYTEQEIADSLKAYERGLRGGMAGTQRRSKDMAWIDASDCEATLLRIKPEPKPPQYRAWEAGEIPHQCALRRKTFAKGAFIVLLGVHLDVDSNPVLRVRDYNGDSKVNAMDALNHWDYSTDGGTTWKPCGVLVEEGAE